MKNFFHTLLIVSVFIIIPQLIISQTPAFPGAEGHGKYVTGGRGGSVYYVTTLEDNNSVGSLRYGVATLTGKRTILFKVSGTIVLKSNLSITKGDVTIAGQSAPGDGICISGFPVFVSSNNVIVRYLRMRMGDEVIPETQADGADAFGARSCKNVIIDHCTVSWCIDECASFYQNQDFTMQWCLVSESMRASKHSKGSHGYGGIWGGTRASFHHNLMAHHDSRNPRFGPGISDNPAPYTEITDMRNNVLYNWCGNAAYGGEGMAVNMINNYHKPGPATPTGAKRGRIVSIDKSSDTSKKIYNIWGKFFIEGNVVDDGKNNTNCNNATNDNWTYGVYNQIASGYGTITAAAKDSMKAKTPYPFGEIKTHTARIAYERVLDYAGACLKRDPIDTRIINEVRTGTATFKGASLNKLGIIDSQADLKPAGAGDNWSAWPVLQSLPAPTDANNDGIPDDWFTSHVPAGKTATDLNEDGYTYLEVYLNSIVEEITTKEYEDAVSSDIKTTKEYDSTVITYFDKNSKILTISSDQQIAEVMIWNIPGNLIKRENCDDTTYSVNLSELSSGVYIVKTILSGKQTQVISKIIS